MKTLGQIGREARLRATNECAGAWEEIDVASRNGWEAAAQAVRAAVIEECAKVSDGLWLESNGTHPWEYEGNVSEAIRSLK